MCSVFDRREVFSFHPASTPADSVFRRNLQALADLAPIDDPRGRRPDIQILGRDDFDNIVEGIYRVRCNLFHGAKRAGDPRDRKLVMTSQRILEKWVGNVVNDF
jgi:hypothetical protein